jgi:hypothetical protein
MNDSSDQSDKRSDGRVANVWSLMQDLYVDLLGSLVPGLFTVILGGAATLSVLSAVHVMLFKEPMFNTGFLGGMKEILAALHWEFATVLFVSAYIIGAVFFRQDTKRPDSASALSVWMNSKNGDRKGLAVQHRKLPDLFKLKGAEDKLSFGKRLGSLFHTKKYIEMLGMDTQFPYLHIRCYLSARGLEHLIRLIPWCPENAYESTHGRRTKMYINIIKIRLLSFSPYASREIIRNEAHVRLATSVWYASRTLGYLSFFLILVLLSAVPNCIRYKMTAALFAPLAIVLLLLFFCIGMLYHLRKCIHYMRVREVLYVLENAYLVEQIIGKDLFSDLVGDTKLKDCTKCDSQSRQECIAGDQGLQ